MRLPGYEADRVPKRFHPNGKVAKNDFSIHFDGSCTVEVVQNIHCKTSCRKRTCGLSHGGMAAAGAVQPDHSGKALPVIVW